MNRIALSALFLAVLLLTTSHAADEDTMRDLSDREVANRLGYIQKALDGGAKTANVWWYGWLTGYSAATIGQAAIYSQSNNKKQKQDMLVGTATSALGVAGQLIAPMAAGSLPARLRTMPDNTPEARRAKLATAEEFLRRSAAIEKLGRSWKTHAMTGAVNLAAGLVIWLHYNRTASDGFITFASGQIISEIQIFTQPTKAVRDLMDYERHYGEHATVNWYLCVTPQSVVVRCSF